MAQESRAQLKTYFETGDKPTEGQFANHIDSGINIVDDTSDDIPVGSSNLFLTIIAQIITGIKTFTNGLIYNARTKSGINSISYALTVSVDFSVKDIHVIGEVTGNLTINTSNAENGQTGVIAFTIDSTGGYTMVLGTGTWTKMDDSPVAIADANVADTKYRIYFALIESNEIEYSIQRIT